MVSLYYTLPHQIMVSSKFNIFVGEEEIQAAFNSILYLIFSVMILFFLMLALGIHLYTPYEYLDDKSGISTCYKIIFYFLGVVFLMFLFYAFCILRCIPHLILGTFFIEAPERLREQRSSLLKSS